MTGVRVLPEEKNALTATTSNLALELTDPPDHRQVMEMFIAAKTYLHQPSIRLNGVVLNSVNWKLFIFKSVRLCAPARINQNGPH